MISAAFRKLPQFIVAHMMAADEDPQPATATFDLPAEYGGRTISFAYPVAGIQSPIVDVDEDEDDDDDDWDDSDDVDGEGMLDAMTEEMAQIAEQFEPGAGKLMQAINTVRPPIRFAIPPALLKQIKPKPAGVKPDTWYEPMGALYAGQEGGIVVALMAANTGMPLVCSLTQLRVEDDHPLTDAIRQYQDRRTRAIR
jgi:hypothetical protein